MLKKTNKKESLPRKPVVSLELEVASGEARNATKNKINAIEDIRLKVVAAVAANQPVPVFDSLMPIVSSMEVLMTAYGNIKSNKGATTPGTERQTADGSSTVRLEKLSEQLRLGIYKFPAVRRTYLPKPGKNVKWTKSNLIASGRPLGMPDFDAKVVQEAIRMVLNAIYEPLFEKTSSNYGFRAGLGCHDAIMPIPSQTQGMNNTIEGDIKGAFPSLNHEKLCAILRRRILDEEFISLIYKCCKAGVFDQLSNSYHDPIIGVPQGGIVSPLLWNIYMHELDKYILTDIADMFNAFNKRQGRQDGPRSQNSPRYRSVLYQKSLALSKYQALTKNTRRKLSELSPSERETALSLRKRFIHLSKQLINMPSKKASTVFLRFHYVRYADDWVLFHNGTPCMSQYIKNKIGTFLREELGLTLAVDKTKITDLRRSAAKFLGFRIYRNIKKKISISASGARKRVTGNKVFIGIDTDRVDSRLIWKGIISKKFMPREQPGWTVLNDYEIVSKYNSIIRGMVNYYAPMINYRSTLNKYIYFYEYSCYKTLCHKHRTTIRKLLRNHRITPLTVTHVPNDGSSGDRKEYKSTLLTVKSYWPILEPVVNKIKLNLVKKDRDPSLLANSDFLAYTKVFLRTKFKFGGRCCICGSKIHVQMHHVKAVRGYSNVAIQGFTKIMGLLNRKQVPVCSFHHDLIHDGKYDHISLSDLYDTRVATPENYLVLNS